MTRAEAVRELARLEVERLTEHERAEQLNYMLHAEAGKRWTSRKFT